MQIPILNGIVTGEQSNFRISYPVNLVPTPKGTGISEGYLRPAEGINVFAETSGLDRGGVSWREQCYRVIGDKLCLVGSNGQISELGFIAGTEKCKFAYGFDRLAITGGQNLYYYDGTSLIMVNDPDLLRVLDVLWFDGYFVSTDGEFLVVTELTDPTIIDPFKYGSSEINPDPINGVLRTSNELLAHNRYTIEYFDNVGGVGFPFRRIDGASINRGTIGRDAACIVDDSVFFVGSGKNEGLAVWLAQNGTSARVSLQDIDERINSVPQEKLPFIYVERRLFDGHDFVYIHLPDAETLVFDINATQSLGQPIWHILRDTSNKYPARSMILCYGKWICGHPTLPLLGALVRDHGEFYGETVRWEFNTPIIYNEAGSAVVHAMEMVCLTGRGGGSAESYVATEYSHDGFTYSDSQFVKAGRSGQRDKRIIWRRQGLLRGWRIQKFWGNSDCQLTIARLQLDIEGLHHG